MQMICKPIVFLIIFKRDQLICSLAVKCFLVLSANTDCFVCTQLNGFKYYYVPQIIQFICSNLFVHS